MDMIFNNIIGFEWDKGNLYKNFIKHKVTNGECEELFFNIPLIIIDDKKHSQKEKRYAAFGITEIGRKLTIVFTIRNKKIRIISARNMNKKERNFYEEKK